MFRFSLVTEFLTWIAFYVLFKAIMHFINIEARRNHMDTVSGVAGLLA